MKKGDVVKLKTGTSAIKITKISHVQDKAYGTYVSSGMSTGWRPISDFEPIQHNPKEDIMTTKSKNSAIISLLQAQRGMTTAKVRIKDANNGLYTYKVQPGMALEVDDYVAVQTGNSVSLGKVVEVDEFADIDLDSDIHYKWVVQKIDMEPVKQLMDEEKSISKQFAAAEAQEKLQKVAQIAGIDLTKIETPMLEAAKS